MLLIRYTFRLQRRTIHREWRSHLLSSPEKLGSGPAGTMFTVGSMTRSSTTGESVSFRSPEKHEHDPDHLPARA